MKWETHREAVAMVLVRDDGALHQGRGAEKWSNSGLIVKSDLPVECTRGVR